MHLTYLISTPWTAKKQGKIIKQPTGHPNSSKFHVLMPMCFSNRKPFDLP